MILPSDVSAAICHLIFNHDATGAFNLTAPAPAINAGFARSVGRVMRRPAVVRVPAFVLRMLFGEMSTVLLTGQRALPSRLQEFGFTFRFPEAEDALEDLFG